MSADIDFIKLDSHLCFALYTSSRAIFRMYRPYLDEMNLTYPQYLVLLVLWEQQMSTIKELGELLDLDSGTLTPLLKRMESAKLVERERNQLDERVVVIRITEEGKALQEKASCIPHSLLASTDMTLEELEDLNATIRKLQQQIKKYT